LPCRLRIEVRKGDDLATRSAIPQPLADDSLHRQFGPLNIVNANPDPVRVPEIELGKVRMKVLLFAVLIYALHASFEHRIEIFHGVRMHKTAAGDVFAVNVVDAFVPPER
jgi:hypothetical protein